MRKTQKEPDTVGDGGAFIAALFGFGGFLLLMLGVAVVRTVWGEVVSQTVLEPGLVIVPTACAALGYWLDRRGR